MCVCVWCVVSMILVYTIFPKKLVHIFFAHQPLILSTHEHHGHPYHIPSPHPPPHPHPDTPPHPPPSQVARAPHPADDVTLLGAIRTAVGPHVHLRADANRGWTPPQAVEFFSLLSNHPEVALEYIEEPVNIMVDESKEEGSGEDGKKEKSGEDGKKEKSGEKRGGKEDAAMWWGRVVEAAQRCGVLLAFDEHVDHGMFLGECVYVMRNCVCATSCLSFLPLAFPVHTTSPPSELFSHHTNTACRSGALDLPLMHTTPSTPPEAATTPPSQAALTRPPQVTLTSALLPEGVPLSAVGALVVKPSLLGGYDAVKGVVQWGQAHGVKVCVFLVFYVCFVTVCVVVDGVSFRIL